MPRSPCIEFPCPRFAVYRGRCEVHAPERERETHPARGHTPTPTRPGQARPSRIYSTKKWRLTRRRKLAASPVCEACGEVLATEVDHVVPIEDGGAPFAEANLQSLCSSCHGRKTAGEVRAREYG